jgi:hypothetical protein
MQDFTDWEHYRSSVDMIRQALSLWNHFLYDWIRGKYDPSETITDYQVEIVIKIIECLGGVLGILPMRPYVPPEKCERLLYLLNEKIKQDFEKEKRDKIQIVRNDIQNAQSFQQSYTGPPIYRNPGDEGYSPGIVVNKYTYIDLQELEKTQPSLLECLPPLQDINEVKAIAIRAGMPTHELEEFIEWQVIPLTADEKDVLTAYIQHINGPNCYWSTVGDMQRAWRLPKEEVDQILQFLAKRNNERSDLPEDALSEFDQSSRLIWQCFELFNFITYFIGEEVRILAQEPIKIPSGKYDESLRVERPQHDLVTDMVVELTRLPRFTAYAKIMQEENDEQTVKTQKIQTHPLPAIQNPNGELQAIANAHTLCKGRDDIEVEIRGRQNRWRGGSNPPPNRRERG